MLAGRGIKMLDISGPVIAAMVGVLSFALLETNAAATEPPHAESRARWLVPAGEARLEISSAREEGEGANSLSAGRLILVDCKPIALGEMTATSQNPRQTVYTARVGQDPEDRLILSRVGDDWHGLLITKAGWSELTGRGENPADFTLAAHAVDQAAVPQCGGALIPDRVDAEPTHDGRDTSNAEQRGLTEYTLLACYTSQSRLAAGGADAIVARVLTAVELTNVTYELSEIDVRVRLVGTLEVPAREDDLGDFDSNLSFFTASGNDFYPQAEPARNLLGADLMTLLIDRDELCGIAWLFSGTEYFGTSVCAWHCVGNTGTLAHEIGHNFGCAHDRPNANNSTAPYGFGHRFTGTDGTLYRTIMSYAPGTRLARFSNPDVRFSGVPTGVPIGQPDEAYNAQVIRDNAQVIAQFRTEEAPDANGNFIDDRDDIANGTSRDGNTDGIPDEVQSPVLLVANTDQQSEWPDAITDAGLAFAAAASDVSLVTEVRFASGTFPIAGVAGDPMLVQDGVRYLGGYDPATNKRDTTNARTVLSGDPLGNDDPGEPATLDDNTRRIAEGFNLSSSTLIDGFTFRDARAFGDEKFGAGCLVRGGGEITFRDCAFTNLSAEFGDPAIAVERNALIRLESCLIAHNTCNGGAAGVGGGEGARIHAADTVFERNTSGFMGGAVSLFAGGPSTFERCRFVENSAVRGGGAIRVAGGGLVISDTFFHGNSGGDGGAVNISANAGPTFLFDRCEFTRNQSTEGGAIFAKAGTRLDIARSRFAGNSATGLGGAIALLDFFPDVGSPSLRMHASTVVGNTAGGDGGAIGSDREGTSVSIASSVIAFNQASGTGGGLSLRSGSLPAIDASLFLANTAAEVGGVAAPAPQFAQITNTAFWGNTDGGDSVRDAQIAILDAGFSIISRNSVQDESPGDGDVWQGNGNLDAEPVHIRPATPGQDGVWGTGDDGIGDWRGVAGNALVDAGSASFMIRDVLDLDGDQDRNEIHPIGVDLRARIAGNAPDIGPAESAPACNPTDLAEPYGTLDLADIAVFVTAFSAAMPPADLNGDGLYDLGDITIFVNGFTDGCP